jgi:hypothetical protein
VRPLKTYFFFKKKSAKKLQGPIRIDVDDTSQNILLGRFFSKLAFFFYIQYKGIKCKKKNNARPGHPAIPTSLSLFLRSARFPSLSLFVSLFLSFPLPSPAGRRSIACRPESRG